MILADTSVWINHIHRPRSDLVEELMQGRVLSHPFVIGEMACGRMRDREVVLAALRTLPSAALASHEETLALLEGNRLHGRGLGWMDLHLLASARLSGARLLTDDSALLAAARELGVAA